MSTDIDHDYLEAARQFVISRLRATRIVHANNWCVETVRTRGELRVNVRFRKHFSANEAPSESSLKSVAVVADTSNARLIISREF
jgi:hypothetical protein